MHVFWEETNVKWKYAQTQGKRLSYTLNILSSCQGAMGSTRIRIDVFARLLDKCQNEISTRLRVPTAVVKTST